MTKFLFFGSHHFVLSVIIGCPCLIDSLCLILQNPECYQSDFLVFRLTELVEEETERYLKSDPDPFDDRHPGRADPTSGFGQLLKVILKNEDFLTKV